MEKNGKYAALRRVQSADEIRSNIHQGATAEPAEITPDILKLIKKVSKKLRDDNMYLVGLDIVGDKIMEINVFSPGALRHISQITEVDFSDLVIEDLEKRVRSFQRAKKSTQKK